VSVSASPPISTTNISITISTTSTRTNSETKN